MTLEWTFGCSTSTESTISFKFIADFFCAWESVTGVPASDQIKVAIEGDETQTTRRLLVGNCPVGAIDHCSELLETTVPTRASRLVSSAAQIRLQVRRTKFLSSIARLLSWTRGSTTVLSSVEMEGLRITEAQSRS